MNYTCSKCKVEKEVSEFYKDRTKKSGHSSRCKICEGKLSTKVIGKCSEEFKKLREQKALNSKTYKYIQRLNKDYVKKEYEYHKKYIESDRIKSMHSAAKRRARYNNLPFNLEISDIIIPEYCPLLNIKMEYNTPYAPSLDRIIPELGYTKGNVIVISRKANTMKNNATLEQLKTFCENALSLYKK